MKRTTVLDDEQLIHLVAKVIAWAGGEHGDQIEEIATATEFQDAAQQCCEDLGLL